MAQLRSEASKASLELRTSANSDRHRLETSASKLANAETDVEMIEVVDGEVKGSFTLCANLNCGTVGELSVAPQFVCSYFGMSVVENCSIKVCGKCYKEAEEHRDILVGMLRKGKDICMGPKRPGSQMVVLDETGRQNSVQSSEEVEMEDCDLSEFVKGVMDKYGFERQITATFSHLEERCLSWKVSADSQDKEIADLQKSMDLLRKELYADHCYPTKQLEPVDIDSDDNLTTSTLSSQVVSITETFRNLQLPPAGTYVPPPIKPGMAIYAMRNSLLNTWCKGKVVRLKDEGEYHIRFDSGGKPRTMPAKSIAYSEPSPVQLAVGCRVIAQYIDEKGKSGKASQFYAGIIAEPPKYLNQYRYLIFFDDGYAQYCTHQQVLVVCHSHREVWHDIHMNSRSFIASYLQMFPERAMVKLQRGQIVKTELNGNWLIGRVESVDASLARIYFVSENCHEWIYRGSTRLHPLFELLANAEARKNLKATRPTHNLTNVHKKRNAPYVEHTRELDVEPQVHRLPQASNVRAVARKSTSKLAKNPQTTPQPSTPPVRDPLETSTNTEHKGRLRYFMNEAYRPVTFERHQCSEKCIESHSYQDGDYANQNPIGIPMLVGWAREVNRQRFNSTKRTIVYRAPCGRRMRTMDEVHRYLRLTGSQLAVDLFCFDSYVHCFQEFDPVIVHSKIDDITFGKENVKVSCVNSIDDTNPDFIEYSTERRPRSGVNLNLDSDFLICCDCTDDCQDKLKCQCWQLTIQATCCAPTGKVDHNAGYQYRRLNQAVVTGLYECNSKCSCRKTCLNRVAQRPLQLRLQAFRTDKRGWGIRCLDDIPKGGFICVYAGELLTEQGANNDGQMFGDEYLAELDHIEVVERTKDGYESDVDVDSESDHSPDSNSDLGAGDTSSSECERETTQTRKKIDAMLKQTEALREGHVSTPAKAGRGSPASKLKRLQSLANKEKQEKVPVKKTRELYGSEEHCYVMDAKTIGNIGRYLNHCCKPNVFVQNVFVDTQDLRFPWVAFFAQVYIRAGTELTWDYSYDVGSVPGRTLYCYCGAKECRGRLL